MVNIALELSSGEIQNIFSDTIRELITSQKEPKTNAEMILSLINVIDNKVLLYKQKNGVYVMRAHANKKLDDSIRKDIYVYGTQLIYLIRRFIFDSDILYHFGAKTNDGKHVSAFIKETEVLKNLAVINAKSVGLSNKFVQELKNLNIKDENLIFNRKNMWKQVEYLSQIRYHKGRNIHKIMRHKHGKNPHWAYQSQKMDNMMYISFRGKNGYYRFYNKDGGNTEKSLIGFNNGNLWEWYHSVLYGSSEEDYIRTTMSIQNHSLSYLFQIKSQDSVAGTKQGDFETAWRQWVQSKYNNPTIISMNRIKKILVELREVFKKYLENSGDPIAIKNLTDKLNEYFYPESARIGSEYANTINEQLLRKLNYKVSPITITT